MIFYFSGTGNSKWIAQELAAAQQDTLYFIPSEIRKKKAICRYDLTPGEKVGFVFPIYSWAPPALVLDFIRRIDFSGFMDHYLYFVCSCGDDTGHIRQVLEKAWHGKGWKWKAGFSVKMPNNYVLFKGFDTDPKEIEEKKLREAIPRVSHINAMISQKKSPLFELNEGRFAFIKTRLINPLFNKYQLSAKPFHATENCIGCQLCASVCPTRNIQVARGPVWGDACTSCLACYHICPRHAVQYGKATLHKGQYFNPNV